MKATHKRLESLARDLERCGLSAEDCQRVRQIWLITAKLDLSRIAGAVKGVEDKHAALVESLVRMRGAAG